jgi:hypothetical protein
MENEILDTFIEAFLDFFDMGATGTFNHLYGGPMYNLGDKNDNPIGIELGGYISLIMDEPEKGTTELVKDKIFDYINYFNKMNKDTGYSLRLVEVYCTKNEKYYGIIDSIYKNVYNLPIEPDRIKISFLLNKK